LTASQKLNPTGQFATDVAVNAPHAYDEAHEDAAGRRYAHVPSQRS